MGRERRVFAVSLAAHALVFACIMHVRASAPREVAPLPVPPRDVELELDLAAPSVVTEAVAAAVEVARVERIGRVSASGPTASSSPINIEAEAPADPAPYASNGTIVVFAPNIGVGAPNAANPFLARGALPDVAAPKAAPDAFSVPENKRAQQAVKDALRARDQSVGLGLEGPVMHALEDATHAGFAPERGAATFMAVIDEHGLVIDLEVLGTHDRGWDDVRTRAAKSLARAKIDLRGVKRAELKIEVTSDVRMPSGTDPNDQYKVTGKRQATPVITSAPGSPSGADTVQTYEVGQYDLSDLGGKRTRVVHAKLVMLVTR